MALLDILEYPDPRLRTKAKPVTEVNDSVKKLVDDMFETMYEAPGIGLAASQVNVHLRIIVIDVSESRNEPLAFINPELTLGDGLLRLEEGCLSVPGIYDIVSRAEYIDVRALDHHGDKFELSTDGILSVCIQHECDHLEGKMFVDYLSRLKQQRIRQKLLKLQRQQQ